MVVAGMPFRDAYKAVAEQLGKWYFQSPKETKHTHEGSINNLCLAEIKMMKCLLITGLSIQE
jgi:argininosuccinate lyase